MYVKNFFLQIRIENVSFKYQKISYKKINLKICKKKQKSERSVKLYSTLF